MNALPHCNEHLIYDADCANCMDSKRREWERIMKVKDKRVRLVKSRPAVTPKDMHQLLKAKMTKNGIGKVIRELRRELERLNDPWQDKDFAKAQRAATRLRDIWFKNGEPERENIRAKIVELEEQWRSEPGLDPTEKEKKFLADIRHGVDWGSKPLYIRWRSDGGRFIIWTQPGSTCWHGIGSRVYHPSTHRLSDLSKWNKNVGISLELATTIAKHEGRLTNAALNALKNAIPNP